MHGELRMLTEWASSSLPVPRVGVTQEHGSLTYWSVSSAGRVAAPPLQAPPERSLPAL